MKTTESWLSRNWALKLTEIPSVRRCSVVGELSETEKMSKPYWGKPTVVKMTAPVGLSILEKWRK